MRFASAPAGSSSGFTAAAATTASVKPLHCSTGPLMPTPSLPSGQQIVHAPSRLCCWKALDGQEGVAALNLGSHTLAH